MTSEASCFRYVPRTLAAALELQRHAVYGPTALYDIALINH